MLPTESSLENVGTIQGPITHEAIRATEQAAIVRLFAIAREKKIADPVIRDLLPNTDLNARSGEIWQQDVSTLGYAMNYSGTNPDDRAFVVYGAKNKASDKASSSGAQLSTAIRFFDGTGRTRIKDIWQIEHGQVEENKIVLAEPDSIIEYWPSLGFNVDFYGRVSGVDSVILLGKTVEPRGKTISPKTKQ